MVRALGANPNESIYCAFDLSAPIALELAKQHHVYLQLPNIDLARLVALLSIAGNYLTNVACSDPISDARADFYQSAPWTDKRTGGNDVLRQLAVPVPPVETQRKIMQKIEQIKTLRQQIKKIEADITKRDRNLSDLFFGNHEAPTKKTVERP
jgi:hypothetical protein